MKKGVLIQFDSGVLGELDGYARGKGISRNAAVNLACSELLGECERVREYSRELVRDADRLRSLVVRVALAKGGYENV